MKLSAYFWILVGFLLGRNVRICASDSTGGTVYPDSPPANPVKCNWFTMSPMKIAAIVALLLMAGVTFLVTLAIAFKNYKKKASNESESVEFHVQDKGSPEITYSEVKKESGKHEELVPSLDDMYSQVSKEPPQTTYSEVKKVVKYSEIVCSSVDMYSQVVKRKVLRTTTEEVPKKMKLSPDQMTLEHRYASVRKSHKASEKVLNQDSTYAEVPGAHGSSDDTYQTVPDPH